MAEARFTVDLGWRALFAALGLASEDVLRHAGLPLDLLHRETVSLTGAEYVRLWQGLETAAGDPMLPIRLIDAMTPDTFSPPVFAGLCSETLDAALLRLAEYKPIIGPMRLNVTKTDVSTTVDVRGLPGDVMPPASFIAMELLFFTHLARLGTRARIVPMRVETPVDLLAIEALGDWLGTPPVLSDAARVTFRREDAERAFLTASPAMWAAFEPSLRKRLSDATAGTDMTGRLRGWLNQSIASGRASLAAAARDLGVSTRSLQRKLSAEGTSFQQELAATREGLARHYLTSTRLSIGEIAFLLGYNEQNSFFRAFHDWTGVTPESLRSGRTS